MSSSSEPPMILDEVVPFGRLFEEYRLMFALGDAHRTQRILGVGDGPASFNAEATEVGWSVVSVDPIYAFPAQEIQKRFDQVVDGVIDQVRRSVDSWTWTYHQSPEQLRKRREEAIRRFSADFDSCGRDGRYVSGKLPDLPFPNASFDLVLCSHLLFLYSDLLNLDFHLGSIREMLRLAPEVRVFPLLGLDNQRSRHLKPVLAELERQGCRWSIERVDYGLQKRGDRQLIIQAA